MLTFWQEISNEETLFLMTTKDLNKKLLNVFQDCPYKGKRKDCTFHEMREVEIDEKLAFLNEIDEDEKIGRWQKHLECLMNALAKREIYNNL